MLYGGFDHTVDKKGRIFIPARFREDLGESFMVSASLFSKDALWAFSKKGWNELVEKISAIPGKEGSALRQYLFDRAFSVEYDAQGRILIPAKLRAEANIEGDAHVVGMNNYVEIWGAQQWNNTQAENTFENIVDIADKFGLSL